jgi:myo-inositol-1(or 4)-monophosphatase
MTSTAGGRGPSPFSEALRVAVEAALEAGAILEQGMSDPDKAPTPKTNRHDPVTVYDRRAEKAIVDVLEAAFPDWGILSEEGTRRRPDAPHLWVIDPLDGTNNFLRGLPHFAVSIGLCDRRGTAVACVHDPCRNETFTAIRDRGARLGGRSMSVSAQSSLDGAVLGVGLSTVIERRTRTVSQLPPLIPHVRSLRLFGSAALDLAYVAAGRFDAIWYLSLHDWDVAAGRLLITEAGGRVSDLRGFPLRTPEEGVLASNGPLHQAMLPLVTGDRVA